MDMGFDFLTCKSVIKLLWVWSLRTSFCYVIKLLALMKKDGEVRTGNANP